MMSWSLEVLLIQTRKDTRTTLVCNRYFRIKMEVWAEDFAETKLINPFLPSGKYSSPVALFLVDLNFCKKD